MVSVRRASLKCNPDTSGCTSEGLSAMGSSLQLTGDLGRPRRNDDDSVLGCDHGIPALA